MPVPVSIGFRPSLYSVLLSAVQPIRDVFLSHALLSCSSAEAQQPVPIVVDAGANQPHMPLGNNVHWVLEMFPEAILFKAERGLRAALLEAAQKERQSASEYVRRRLRAALQADGIELPPFEPETGAPARRAA